jgi:hypothetical protein
VATFSAVQRQHVLQAIEECDRRGRADFLGVYGFEPAAELALLHEGRGYDAQAILGVAHRYATGRLATAAEFHGGPDAALDLLRRRGFEVTVPVASAPARRPAPARAARATTTAARPASRRPAPVADRPVRTCPTCFMVLPATGVCDQCG